MTEQQAAAAEPEAYSGASLDVIEVPDEDIAILEEMASPPKDEDEAGEQEVEASSEGTTEQEEIEEEDQTKRNLYKEPRNKLVREWHEAKEAQAAAQAKNDVLQQELEELRNQVKSGKGESGQPDSLEDQETELLRKRKEAEEDADLEEYSKANDQLAELRLKKIHAEMKAQEPAPKVAPETPAKTQTPPSIHPDAQAWLDRNEWYSKPENAALAAYAGKIEDQLIDSGMRYGKEMYKELDKTLSEMSEFSEVVGKKQESEHEEKPSGGKPRHMLPPSRPGGKPAGQKAGELSQYDRATMKRFNLDPSNPKHKSAYLKRKGAAK